jgi:mycothiol system anti-sigma-R factor
VHDIECTEVLGHIEAFLDFELAKDSCSLVTEHLKHCGFCNDHAFFAREVRDIVARKCKKEPPAELAARIRASLTTSTEESGP